MIRSAKQTIGYTVQAQDGEVGKIVDLYLEDKEWIYRYLVVDTGGWLNGRVLLISPASISEKGWADGSVRLNDTRERLKNSPDINTKAPVSRHVEMEFHRYYGFPFYWGGDAIWGPGMTPGALAAAAMIAPVLEQEEQQVESEIGDEESHLRSTEAVAGYTIHARDGDVGHVDDFVFDDESFRINFIVVDTSKWLAGKKVIIPPTWVTRVDWASREVWVDLKRDTVKDSPEYDLKTINKQS